VRHCSTGEKIELYTTRTVNESYKRKVNAITGLADVGEYYTFRLLSLSLHVVYLAPSHAIVCWWHVVL
jgi:hypothetical protein